MLSDFQRKKLTYFFNLYDMNHDGQMMQADFMSFSERLAEKRQLQRGTVAYEVLTAIQMGWWQVFRAAADLHRHNHVTLDEFLAFWNGLLTALEQELARGDTTLQDQLRSTADAVFNALDADHNDQVELNEYTDFLEALGVQGKIAEAFGRLDLNGDTVITREEMRASALEFFTGNDPEAPGTWLYGVFAL